MEIRAQPLTFFIFLPFLLYLYVSPRFSAPFSPLFLTRMLCQLKFSFRSPFPLSPFPFHFFAILIPANNLIKRFAFYIHVGFVWHVRLVPLDLCTHKIYICMYMQSSTRCSLLLRIFTSSKTLTVRLCPAECVSFGATFVADLIPFHFVLSFMPALSLSFP